MNRALALAEALRRLGRATEMRLVRGSLSGGEAQRAAAVGLTVLPAGAPEATGVVVVDLPDLGSSLVGLNPEGLVVFDDRDAFAGRAAIVVQPSQPRWTGPGQADLVLAGWDFVPFSAGFRLAGSAGGHARRAGEPFQVVACFGGSDPARVSERLAPVLRSGPRWRTELILGAGYRGRTDGWPVTIVPDPADLPTRLAAADLVLLGAGTMKFEAACLGRPAILVAVADDQLTVGPSFARTGAAIYLGDGRTIEPDRIRAAIEDLLSDRPRREALGRRAAEVVDGRGADRLAEAIASLSGNRP